MQKIPRFSLQFLVKTNARFARAIFTAGFPLQSLTQNEFRVSTSEIHHPTSQYFKIFSTASANSSLGINWSSSFLLNGIGVSIEATRKIGASKSSKQCSEINAESSAPNPQVNAFFHGFVNGFCIEWNQRS